MFPIPNTYNEFKILAIDPGLNNIGVAIFNIQANPLTILSIEALTLKEDKVLSYVPLDEDYVTERMVKRFRMVDGVLRFVKEVQPSVLVSESPFFNRLMPSSFAVLTEVITDIFNATLEYNNNIRIATVEPLLVKHTLGVAGKKGKDVVREAMEKIDEVISVLNTPIDTLDEHAIDAIGVGLTYFKRRLNEGEVKK